MSRTTTTCPASPAPRRAGTRPSSACCRPSSSTRSSRFGYLKPEARAEAVQEVVANA